MRMPWEVIWYLTTMIEGRSAPLRAADSKATPHGITAVTQGVVTVAVAAAVNMRCRCVSLHDRYVFLICLTHVPRV